MSKLYEMNTPVFWAEGHPGKLEKDEWSLEVSGKCENPKILNWKDIIGYDKTIVEGRLTSVTRWSVFGKWGGISLKQLLNDVKYSPTTKYVRFWSFGMVYDTSIPLEIALKAKTILAYEFDSDFLEEDYGGPVRVFCPYLWGYKSAKSVLKIELMENYVKGYWEKRGYTDSAEIEAGEVIDINTGRLRKIPSGEVIEFLD